MRIETRENLKAAITCYRAFYRLTRHEAHRPSYPDWVVKPDPVQEVVWEQFENVVYKRVKQPSYSHEEL
jgi:hypothetical protein